MKRKNKGFTLIELLAVIIILAIILALVTMNVSGISKKQQTNNRRNAFSDVLTAAKRYVADHPEVGDKFCDYDKEGKSNKSDYVKCVSVNDLIENDYLDIDPNEYSYLVKINPSKADIYYNKDGEEIYNLKLVRFATCNGNSNQEYFYITDSASNRSAATFLENKNPIKYNDCGCEDQSGESHKICVTKASEECNALSDVCGKNDPSEASNDN